jgi:signal transduction histidine kinase/ActR/RegA family two-component response regulator
MSNPVARDFLLEASAALASSLDVEKTLARLAELAVPRLADACLVRLVDADGNPAEAGVAHRDPACVPLMRGGLRRFPSPESADWGVPWVLRTGRPELTADVEAEHERRGVVDPAHIALLRRIGVRATLLVPMRVAGRVLGVLSFVQGESGRTFAPDDVALAQDLADRAAVALDNARLYRRAREDHMRLQLALGAGGMGLWELELATGRVTWSEGLRRLYGVSEDPRTAIEALEPIHPDDRHRVACWLRDVLLEVGPTETEWRGLRGGETRWLVGRGHVERDESGAPLRMLGVVLDLTDRKRQEREQRRLEDELARASKLESLGVLAGGIAHDFNNILTAVVANLSLAGHRVGRDHPARARIDEAARASERARDLTRQLLTFARGGAPVKTATAVEEVLRESAGFALQGSRSRAECVPAPGLWAVDADPGQLGQVVHNLVLNADQAMPAGGIVRLAAENVTLVAGELPPLPSGRYVRVRVSDQGAGIAPEIVDRVFDPFFTTKASGSGLGLATAYSIVRRHGGHIRVDSSLGEGTTFELHLPAAAGDVAPRATEPERPQRGAGRVLVMDDDPHVRALAAECAGELGYDAVVTTDGEAAIRAWEDARAAGRPFDVVVMDLTVPGAMGGREAVQVLRARDPNVRALVSSGYFNDPVLAEHAAYGFVGAIQKPWRLEELARVLRGAMDR